MSPNIVVILYSRPRHRHLSQYERRRIVVTSLGELIQALTDHTSPATLAEELPNGGTRIIRDINLRMFNRNKDGYVAPFARYFPS